MGGALIGQVIGKHRVIEKIADGVTGAVYKAEHTVIGRHVAIKILRSEYSADPELVTRFFEVLRTVSAVEHPSIVQMFDFGYYRDAAYIVMELLSFETVEERVRREGRMRMSFSLDIVSQVVDALVAVHEKGIIHEDLKADNIALVPDPAVTGGQRAKLLDFGLATLLTDTGTGARKVRNEAELPIYTAPEQLIGNDEVDHRADLYALGAIWYEMLCGRPPFTSRDLLDLVRELLGTEAPMPRALVATIPAEVEDVIMGLLVKDPAQRTRSARELSAAIDELQGDFMTDISSVGVRPSFAKIRFSTYRPEIDGPATPDQVSADPLTIAATGEGSDARPATARVKTSSNRADDNAGSRPGEPAGGGLRPSLAVILTVALLVVGVLVAVALL